MPGATIALDFLSCPKHVLYYFRLEAPLQPAEVAQRLRSLSREAAGFFTYAWTFGPDVDPPFLGTVKGSRFSLRRDAHYRNSFLPMLKGIVRPSPRGSRVIVVMHLHAVVLVFMLAWFGALGVSAVSVFASQGPVVALAPGGLLIFGVVVTALGFYPEALKARRILEENLGSAGV